MDKKYTNQEWLFNELQTKGKRVIASQQGVSFNTIRYWTNKLHIFTKWEDGRFSYYIDNSKPIKDDKRKVETFIILLTTDLKRRLKIYAAEQNRTMAGIVRELIEQSVN